MNLTFFKYFKDTYESKSVTRAALENGVSATAISKGIKSLERIMELNLINHKKKRLEFTKDADLIYDRVVSILEKVQNLTNIDVSSTRLKLGILHSLATSLFADAIAELSIEKDLQVYVSNPTEIKNMLARHLIDIGVTIKRKEKDIDPNSIIYEGSFHLFQSSKTKIKDKIIYTTPKWPEVIEFNSKSQNLIEKGYRFVVVDSWDVIYGLIKQGKGYGLLPDYFEINNPKIKKSTLMKFQYEYKITLIKQNSFLDFKVVDLLMDQI